MKECKEDERVPVSFDRIYFLKHNVIKNEFKAKGLEKACEALDRDSFIPEEWKACDCMLCLRSENLSAIAFPKLENKIESREKGRIERGKNTKEREERERLAGENEILLAKITRLKQNEPNNHISSY